ARRARPARPCASRAAAPGTKPFGRRAPRRRRRLAGAAAGGSEPLPEGRGSPPSKRRRGGSAVVSWAFPQRRFFNAAAHARGRTVLAELAVEGRGTLAKPFPVERVELSVLLRQVQPLIDESLEGRIGDHPESLLAEIERLVRMDG